MTLAPYISQAVLERLKSGTFVADRRSNPGALRLRDRRDTLSPLAVTKRCVRYDHHVFANRAPLIIQLAESLNDPAKKLAMVSGPQGCGKTSLIRGIVELMGGGREQLLWFDVNVHTDFEEVIGFLIQSITTLCSALSLSAPEEGRILTPTGAPPDPFMHLERLIDRVNDVPLLIVIDNIEYLVNSEHQLMSQPLKETLNYLLSFPNLKVILCGERMPYADIRARGPAMTHLQLAGLSLKEVQALIAESSFPPLGERRMMALCRKTQGRPWLLKLAFYLQKKLASDPERHAAFLQELTAFLDDRAAAATPAGVDDLDGLEAASPVEPIIHFIYRRLSPGERKLTHALALIRHPVDIVVLGAMFPGLLPEDREAAAAMLDHSLLTPLMKRIFSPQAVMAHIRKRHEPPSTFLPSYEFYRQARKLLMPLIPEAEQIQLRRALEAFYLRERDLPQSRRAYPVKTRILAEEAARHATLARQRRTGAARDAQSAIFRTESPAVVVKTPPAVATSAPLSFQAASAPASTDAAALDSGLAPSGATPRFRDALAAASLPPLEAAPPRESKSWEKTPEETPSRSNAPPLPTRAETPAFTDDAVSSGAGPDLPPPSAPLAADAPAREIQQRLADAVTRRDQPAVVESLLALAECRQSAGRSQDAEACLRAALSHAHEIPPSARVNLHQRWARFCVETFRPREALEALEKALTALDAAPEAADAPGADAASAETRIRIYDQTGDLLALQGRPHEALAAYFKALDLQPAPETARERQAAYAERYFKIAQLYDDLAMPDNALTYYEQCLSLDREMGSALSCAATLTNIGALQLERERPQEALASFKAALEFDRRAENAEGAHQTLMLMAMAQLRLGETASAEECYRQALANAIREENSLWKANVYLKLARLYLASGEAERALVHYQSARASIDPGEVSADSLSYLDQQIKETLYAIQRPSSDPTG